MADHTPGTVGYLQALRRWVEDHCLQAFIVGAAVHFTCSDGDHYAVRTLGAARDILGY